MAPCTGQSRAPEPAERALTSTTVKSATELEVDAVRRALELAALRAVRAAIWTVCDSAEPPKTHSARTRGPDATRKMHM